VPFDVRVNVTPHRNGLSGSDATSRRASRLARSIQIRVSQASLQPLLL
jgi:hypothetical protein